VGAAIPLESRLVACCDAFSAMTTDRSYRPAMTLEAAVLELRVNAGTQFDPAVVEAMITVLGRKARAATVAPALPDVAPVAAIRA
jgi:HD-GYP domain-containing protein (c-di-GMP phosphodiesterase class II)